MSYLTVPRHPGDVIRRNLRIKEGAPTLKELSEKTGIGRITLDLFLSGYGRLDGISLNLLAEHLGGEAETWIRMQEDYFEYLEE